jgi:hypothetical protein
MGDLARRGFVIENEWYWRITENAQTFDPDSAVRDFLVPLARAAKSTLAIDGIVADAASVRLQIDGQPAELAVERGAHDRVAVNHFVGELNRALATTRHAFALVAPRRYELRGVLLTDDELAALAGDPVLLVPSGRPSWRSIDTPHYLR